MKSTITSVLIMLIFSAVTFAQLPCDQKALEIKEFSWNRDIDAQPNLPGPVNAPKEQAVVKSIAEIAQAIYPKPKGGEIYWHGNYEISRIENQYPNSYSNDIILKKYKCANNKVTLVGYTASLFVNVNSLGFMGGSIVMNGTRYSTVRALSAQKDGYIYYNFDENDRIKGAEEWIITYRDKLPYTYLSRKEYLTEARADQAMEMEKAFANNKKSYKVRPQAEQDAEKQKLIEGFKKSYQGAAFDARIAQFNRDYKSDQQRLDEANDYTKKNYERILKIYDDCLKNNSEDYLSKPAIVLPYTRANFEGFEKNMKDKNNVYIIKDDPSYYNRNLPVSSPQYITVLLRHNFDLVPDKFFYDGLNKKELLDNLSALLGK